MCVCVGDELARYADSAPQGTVMSRHAVLTRHHPALSRVGTEPRQNYYFIIFNKKLIQTIIKIIIKK